MKNNGSELSQSGVQSVEIAARILDIMARSQSPLPLKAITEQSGLHRAKVHRYLVSLTRTGLVSQNKKTGYYSIGPQAVIVGLAGMRLIDPIRLAQESLYRLRDATNETACLMVWGNMGPTVVAIEESTRPITTNLRIGSVVPLTISATGRVFLAYLPRETTREFVERERAAMSNVPDDKALEKIIGQVQENRLAAIKGTMLPGVNALAAPVFDYNGKLSSVIGLVGRKESFDPSSKGRAAEVIAEVAMEISRDLGFLDPSERVAMQDS